MHASLHACSRACMPTCAYDAMHAWLHARRSFQRFFQVDQMVRVTLEGLADRLDTALESRVPKAPPTCRSMQEVAEAVTPTSTRTWKAADAEFRVSTGARSPLSPPVPPAATLGSPRSPWSPVRHLHAGVGEDTRPSPPKAMFGLQQGQAVQARLLSVEQQAFQKHGLGMGCAENHHKHRHRRSHSHHLSPKQHHHKKPLRFNNDVGPKAHAIPGPPTSPNAAELGAPTSTALAGAGTCAHTRAHIQVFAADTQMQTHERARAHTVTHTRTYAQHNHTITVTVSHLSNPRTGALSTATESSLERLLQQQAKQDAVLQDLLQKVARGNEVLFDLQAQMRGERHVVAQSTPANTPDDTPELRVRLIGP